MKSPKKKIAFVIASLASGGAERVISNLSNDLIEKFEIVIITFEKSTPFYTLDKRIKVIPCLNSIIQPSSFIQSFKLNYNLTKRIYQILKSEQVNIVIGFITSANILATIAAKFYRIPCIISERNNPIIEDVPKFWVLLRKFIYPIANKVVLQTKGVKKIYDNKIDAHKIHILPNPISSELTQLRDSSVYKENLILTVGRLDKNKCQEDLIKAFSSINVENWNLLIIGEGHKKQELTNLINSLNLGDKIKIISKVKNIDEYYNKASIFVFTSKTEGFPNALLEAMHFGLPCISTDCDFGPSDLINDGENGFLVPVNQEVILSQRLQQLMCNKELRDKFSSQSKLSTDNYQSKKVVKQWEDLINSTFNRV
ncbi:glycosyltransferase family 4 protein [Psychroserpens damuponensis]|uniref:glycosyltransferase family 4 protein n=1 Tax=Psychroserpens damuponensis TaxID=943936 RepID=UPI00058F3D1A|nr:glycosyltransferase family 4 protein [Psychroserpens damuponensis]